MVILQTLDAIGNIKTMRLIKLTRGVCRGLPCYAASPKNCLVFWKRQPWVSLADVTLLVGVHKSFGLKEWKTVTSE